jgi:hypothetical protein
MINSGSFFPDSSTLANFKSWAQFLSNALAAGGWVLQGDSGQVNWSTIGTPPVGGAFVYEVWKSADALTSACPITLKIEYGCNAAANGPAIAYTVGTNGTDGAGGMQAPHGARCVVGFYSSEDSTSVQYPCYVSADTGRFSFVMFDDGVIGFPHAYYCANFSLSRSVDHTGVATGDYVFVCSFPGTPGVGIASFQQVIHNAGVGGVEPLLSVDALIAVPNSTDVSVSGANCLLSPVFPFVGTLGNPTGDIFMGHTSDFSDGAVVSMLVYNVSKNFIVHNQAIAWRPNAACAALIRYE